ncbi:hypothetical protein DFS33DRAFT_1380999 [Desarmillaria ectypa]|nr:hypothetical protein DFS33DRAFT_1380999 [Desarmillaria ectypa]
MSLLYIHPCLWVNHGNLGSTGLRGNQAQYTEWRTMYYFAVGMQVVVLVGCYAMIPDYVAKNRDDLVYWELLRSMMKFAACLVNLLSAAGFSNFSVTLTFLLGGPPYNYSTCNLDDQIPPHQPVNGAFWTDRNFWHLYGTACPLLDELHPWYSMVLGSILYARLQALLLVVGAAGIHTAPVSIITNTKLHVSELVLISEGRSFWLDTFCRILKISVQMLIFNISVDTSGRLNALFLISLFLGQVMDADAGSRVFLTAGWQARAGLSLGWTNAHLLLLLVFGPHCERNTWFGYEGEFRMGKKAEPIHKDSETGENTSEGNLHETSEVAYIL